MKNIIRLCTDIYIFLIFFFLALSERLDQLVQPKPRHKEWKGDRLLKFYEFFVLFEKLYYSRNVLNETFQFIILYTRIFTCKFFARK